MQLYGDFHTHTLYSHGRGTIEDNVKAAISQGLKAIAITDHGFRHTAYNVRPSDFKFMRKDVMALRQKYPNIEILLGLETNIQGMDGAIDVRDRDLDKLDIIVCGFHRLVVSSNPKQAFTFWLPELWNSIFRKPSAKRLAATTDAFIQLINRYPIDILSHPKYGIELDVVAVAKEAARLGTFLELNGKKISMTDREIEGVLDAGATLICDSDAHSPDRVGEIKLPLQVVERLHIPPERIANFGDTMPDFRSRRERAARMDAPTSAPK